MKKFFALIVTVLLIFAIIPFSASGEHTSSAVGCSTLDGKVPFLGNQRLVDNVVSTVLYEASTDTLMYADNADEPLPPVSLAKILTALIAIEKGTLSDAVTVRADVLNTLPKDAAVVGLITDEVLTLEDLINCMIVASGNDAAAVLADHVMGSQQAFVNEMNRYASEFGCTGTNFTNVHGLSDPNQYTTARDMARILAQAIKNEKFCEIFGDIYYNVPETNKSPIRYLSSENYLMNDDMVMIHYDSRVTGSRTGIANDWSRSIASVANSNGLNFICIVMGAESVYEDDGYTVKVFGGYNETRQLLDMGFNGHKTAQILFENQILKQCSVSNGNCDVSIGTHDSAFSVIPETMDALGLSYRYMNEVQLSAPIEKGQKLSSVQVWCGSACVAEADLYAMNSVDVIETVSQDNVESENGFFVWILYGLGIVFGITLIGFIIISILRAVHISKRKKMHRRYRRRGR